MRKPELWVIAGVNGSGKSTFIEKFNRKNIPIVNPDIIALQISKEDTTLRNAKAGRQAIEQRRALLQNKKDFGVETTLTGNSPLKLIAEAKNHGYKVNIVYLGLDTLRLSRDRVDARVEAGGHNIPSEDIMRRYPKSFENLKQVLKEVDNAYIFNNSGKCRQKVFILNKEKISYIGSDLQPWVQDILQSCIEQGYKAKERIYLEPNPQALPSLSEYRKQRAESLGQDIESYMAERGKKQVIEQINAGVNSSTDKGDDSDFSP